MKRVPPSPSLALSLSLSRSLLRLPFRWLLFSRSLLTRQAEPPYPEGGPSLLGRRTLLTRGRRVFLTAREADTPHPSPLGRRILRTREADTPHSGGGYSSLGRRILVRACLTPGFCPPPAQAECSYRPDPGLLRRAASLSLHACMYVCIPFLSGSGARRHFC